ncbi:hypothetical protein AAFF_G00224020 [Aldrovandia affinis]|uniref:Uncharacterized protein n=1 Tax=Aldrovandia affinis TaxID=143900 RepID=A0AAD7TAW8_9TELE|nr:hypothetical protein AAFF_G00224020 [Aldrovandia affinis]
MTVPRTVRTLHQAPCSRGAAGCTRQGAASPNALIPHTWRTANILSRKQEVGVARVVRQRKLTSVSALCGPLIGASCRAVARGTAWGAEGEPGGDSGPRWKGKFWDRQITGRHPPPAGSMSTQLHLRPAQPNRSRSAATQ